MTALNSLLITGNLAEAVGVICPARSGAMTGIAADADVYGLRNVGLRPFRISMIRFRWVTTTAFTSAQCLAFCFSKVVGMQMVHDTGSPVTVQAHYKSQSIVPNTTSGSRLPNSSGNPPLIVDPPATNSGLRQVALDCAISGTAAITMSNPSLTYTAPDADEPDIYLVSAGSTLPVLYEDWQPRDGLSLVLEQNEGMVGKNAIALGAAGVGRLYIAAEGYFL